MFEESFVEEKKKVKLTPKRKAAIITGWVYLNKSGFGMMVVCLNFM